MILLQLSYGVFFRYLVITIVLIGEGIGFAEFFSGTITNEPPRILESQFSDEDTDHQTLVHVSIPILILSAIPLLCIAGISRTFDPVLANDVVVGMARSFVQLMVLGWILHPIFVMGIDWPWLVGLYIIFMTLIATRETVTKVKYTYQYHSLLTFLSIIMSISAVGTFAFLCIIQPQPRWNPQYVIPICGMFTGNCISGMRLTVNHLSIQIMEGGRREIELYLSFGASGWQSVRRLVNEAVGAGVTPLLNSLNVIGLVSIPGMMTGQILGGSPVTEAAHYQILIMYLIATCTFIPIFLNLFIVYRMAFNAQTHALRTDRFFEVVKTKQKQKEIRIGITQRLLWGVKNLVYPIFGRQRDMIGNSEIQPLENTSGNEKTNRIQILTRQFACNEFESEPLFCIADLSFSVPKSHRKIRLDHPRPLSTPESEMSTAPTRSGRNSPQLQSQQTSVLCTNLNASIHVGEIGIVRGPSGCGKSSLLRVLAGLAPMDGGDVMVSGQSLAACSGRNGGSMVQWRTSVRYVTQHKADLPGTPRDFILRILSFYSHSTFETPSEDEMMTQILSNLQHWGMGESTGDDDSYTADADLDQDHNSYLDNEWKTLSGGESQRILLAIAMASRAKVLLLDEATSGLDNETEKLVEESIIDYAKKNGAAVLWVTHSEDIVERLLSRQC